MKAVSKQIVLNQEAFKAQSPEERLTYIYSIFDPEEILVTSSFGIQSAALLHMIHKVRPEQPIHFINTGYLYKETRVYKEYLTSLWDLKVIENHPEPFKHFKTELFQMWEHDPDGCCHINKVDALMPLLWKHRVWVSGLMGHQNQYRSELSMIDQNEHLVKFYPIIDHSEDDIRIYQLKHAIPAHPLADKGYASVGCTHCTVASKDRSGRWSGKEKTECGLHRMP